MPALSSCVPVPWQSEIVPQGWGCGVAMEWDLVLARLGKGACGPLPWSPTW